jgi:type VI secretion system activator RovC-like protein
MNGKHHVMRLRGLASLPGSLSKGGSEEESQLMKKPLPDPDVAETAPASEALTRYDEKHIITYLRMLDADAEGADWREVALIVLHIDPAHEPDRARLAFESHLARAKWIIEHGYRQLLRGGVSGYN